jgi:hypothetical protein
VGKQTVRQAATLAASQAQARCRCERVERDRRLERLVVEVLTALGERDAMIAATGTIWGRGQERITQSAKH